MISSQTIKLIKDMLEFQKQNNIRNQCVTNSQLLYEILKDNKTINVKVIPVIVDSYVNCSYELCYGHLVVEINKIEILESSLDIVLMPKRKYYKSIKEYIDEYLDNDKINFIYKNKENLKELVKEFIEFTKLAEQMNKGETIADREYLYSLTNYCFEKLN